MAKNLAQKILETHLVGGTLDPGETLAISIDQTLTQDATGTMTYLQFEVLGIPKVRTRLSVSYVDHNTLQTGFENADDHRFLQTVAAKYGILFSKGGNGICHQVHLERFAKPGETLLGSDSHTPNAGAMGMIALGSGGLDVAIAMAGEPYHLKMPEIVLVRLKGKLPPWVTSKDIILELLRRLTVKGGLGKIFEFGGPGVRTLCVPERATMANLGVELGATTSLFPSDENTLEFLRAQDREKDWIPLEPDPDARYDGQVIEIDLRKLEPLIAQPSSPDNVFPVREVEGRDVRQICIGSCNNSSYLDLMGVARILKGRKVHPDVSLTISPGSKQVLEMIARNGALADLVSAGARILESACGPCIGMGQAPPSHAISIRTVNRNFPGRSGTVDDKVYLASPYVAAACALRGTITDPRTLGPKPPRVPLPKRFLVDDSLILRPSNSEEVVVERGPNIKPLPIRGPLEDVIEGPVLVKVGDNITTDDILPAGAKILPLRSNIPAISQFVFERIDPNFVGRAKQSGGGLIVGGENYGQGSSREHAALAPMYLGIKAILAKSYARIHRSNLINFGILPLIFRDPEELRRVQPGDQLRIGDPRERLEKGESLRIENLTQQRTFEVSHDLDSREIEVMIAGGLLNYIRNRKS